jgi:hypothetical protein
MRTIIKVTQQLKLLALAIRAISHASSKNVPKILCLNFSYYLNGTQVGQNCNNITLGQSISINETCNTNKTWGPVSLDAVSCNYLLPPCAKCQLIGTNQDTEAQDSSSYQIDNQWCLAVEIVCAGSASSFACME